MNTLHDHLKTARNRLAHNGTSLDFALALAEQRRLPLRHIQAIERLLADTKKLFLRHRNLAKRIQISSRPPPGQEDPTMEAETAP